MSTAITSNNQGVTGVTDKATTTPTTITTDSTVNDNDTTTSATSDKIWSPKQKRELRKLSTDLVPAPKTQTGRKKRNRNNDFW